MSSERDADGREREWLAEEDRATIALAASMGEGREVVPKNRLVHSLAREVLRLGERLDAAPMGLAVLHKGVQEALRRTTALEMEQHPGAAHLQEIRQRLGALEQASAQPIQQGERIEGEEYERVRRSLDRSARSARDWRMEDFADAWLATLAKLPPGATLIVQPPEDEGEDEGGESVHFVDPEHGLMDNPASPPTAPEDASEEMEPCPFCGTDCACPNTGTRSVGERWFISYCRGQTDDRLTVEEAVEDWNRRTPSEPVDAERERAPNDEQRAAAFDVLRDALDGVRREPFPDITRHAAGCLDRVLASLEAGREREEAVERVAKWLKRNYRGVTASVFLSQEAVDNHRRAEHEQFRAEAARLLSECFPSPDQGAEP